jgi:mannose-6-phosphate isomerase-like protein (cupin superfamily)
MILRASDIHEANGRRAYPLPSGHGVLRHFVTRITLPDNPFAPHAHAEPEVWYIQEGEALLSLGDAEERVAAGDLVVIEPHIRHGLRTRSRVKWVCMA